MATIKYRKDIDGLRALAVILVILFHLSFSSVSGGYIGVDVFFIISGFLITSIIIKKCSNSQFTLTDFYLNRIRRLFPALYTVILLTFLFSFFILQPYDFTSFSKSTIAALFSFSNITFYLESGYWDTVSELKPLLHTWSLGVEEQFYLIWPIFLLFLLSKFKRESWCIVFIFITTLFFALTFYISQLDLSAAFYLFPFRIFQFSAGALIFAVLNAKYANKYIEKIAFSNCLFIIGITLILYSSMAFDGDTKYPNVAVLLPTLGTLFLLLAGGAGGKYSFSRIILTNSFSVWVGRISYSLYLVHWPIIVLYKYQTGTALTSFEKVYLLIATFMGGALLHYLVEKRFYSRNMSTIKQSQGTSIRKFSLITLSIGLFFSVIAGHAALNNGWEFRFQSLKLTAADIQNGKQDRFSEYRKACQINNYNDSLKCDRKSPTQVLVLGNSHEPDGFNFINAGYQKEHNLNIINFGTINLCKGLKKAGSIWVSTNSNCQKRLVNLFGHQFLDSIDYVVYSANRPFAANKILLFNLLNDIKLKNDAIKIITIGGYINTKLPCSKILNDTGSTTDCTNIDNVSYFAHSPSKQPSYKKIMGITHHFIDRVSLLCREGNVESCFNRTEDGVPMFYDQHHLSRGFAEMAGKMYANKYPYLFDL
ncbi:acyltransferase family protein [Colwelliaceae bacterium 6441]